MTPLAIDLFCGLGGWTEGLLAEGYWVVGFDIERHEYWMPEITDESNGSKETKPVEKRGWTAQLQSRGRSWSNTRRNSCCRT